MTCAVRLLREPLAHFLIIGAAIFGLYSLTSEAEEAEREGRIVVAAAEVDQLRTLWERQWQRPPTEEELEGLIEARIREEVLYREALAMGLDRDDTVIRRRLVQKLEFLTEDLAAAREPTEIELAAYFVANKERYRVAPRLSFSQIYFNPDRRGLFVEREAGLVLAGVRDGPETAAVSDLGDRTMLGERYRRQTPQEIAAVFGQEFAEALLRLKPRVWCGPIASGYGVHLVRVEERVEGHLPSLAEAAEEVRADWAYDQRRQTNDAIFARLFAHYEVTIEPTASGAASIDKSGTDERTAP